MIQEDDLVHLVCVYLMVVLEADSGNSTSVFVTFTIEPQWWLQFLTDIGIANNHTKAFQSKQGLLIHNIPISHIGCPNSGCKYGPSIVSCSYWNDAAILLVTLQLQRILA